MGRYKGTKSRIFKPDNSTVNGGKAEKKFISVLKNIFSSSRGKNPDMGVPRRPSVEKNSKESLFRKMSAALKVKAGPGESFSGTDKSGARSMPLRPGRRMPSVTAASWLSGIFSRITDLSFYRSREARIAIAGILSGCIIAFTVILVNDFHKVKALADFQPNVTTKIYDKNDVLISELFKQKREVVPREKIPDNLINAFVAIEDNEFYSHYGINIKGIVRAFFINVFSGRIRQGGSTITQQLSKILLTSRKRNIFRKVKEAFIAVMMEFKYSKDEIIGMYLNQIFLGHGTYGVESASRLYFRKHVWELNAAECALLATLPSAPNLLSPIRHPKRSMQRHRIVLAKMVEMGFLTVEQAEEQYLTFWPHYLHFISEIAPTVNTWSSRVNRAPWFTEYIRRKLIKKYGEETVYEEGLLVYTTLDLKKQQAGQKILGSALEKQTGVSSRLAFRNTDIISENYADLVGMFTELFELPGFRKRGSRRNEKINNYFQDRVVEELEGLNYIAGIEGVSRFVDEYRHTYLEDRDYQGVEGCIISINHNNGYIEAMIGGSEFSSINQLNRVIQARRQPGSSIKPLLYTAAIESKKFTPATAVLDSPIVYLDNEGGDWLPENYEGEYYGLVRLRKALALSINIISIRVADTLGIGTVMDYYARLLKFDSDVARRRIPRNFSIALGSLEVSPFELTRAYAIIAGGGKDVIPFSIRYIRNRDGDIIENRQEEVKKILLEKKKEGKLQVINPDTAQVMISLMKGVIAGGTGSAASPGRPAGGKTGTTNNWRDAWFMGFVPQLTTGMWIGYDGLGLSLGIGQSGGSVVAPVWGEYMRAALADSPVLDFPVYAPLAEKEVCSRTGLLPSPDCRDLIREVFIPGTEPEKECDSCIDLVRNTEMAKKGPRENISRRQKRSILRNIKKGNSDSIVEDIGKDLLQ